MELRKYQIECLEKVKDMQVGERKICYLPTGSGKTVVMSAIAKETKGRVLIVVMSTELRQQTIDKLKMICGNDVNVGSVQANLNETDSKIVVATRQSLTHPKSKRMDELISNGEFDVICIDECHVAVSQYKKIVDTIGTNAKVIGFTATPWNQDMKSVFDGFIYEKTLLEMIEEKYLCEPKCYAVQTECDLSKVKTIGGEFVQKDLAEAVDNVARNELIVKAYLEKASDRKQTIVFATSIDHATNLANCFNLNGISARSIDSTIDKDERKSTFEDFKSNKFRVLVNVNICSIGLDIPSVDCIVLARPTKSKMLYVQQLGRGLRLSPKTEKKNCIVIDIVDNVNKFNLVNCKSIFDVEDGETILEAKQRKQYEKEENEKLLEEQRSIEEEQERLRLEEIDLFNSNVLNVFEYSNLDWFSNRIDNKNVMILSSKIDKHYVIYKSGNEFYCYVYKNLENYEHEFELYESNADLRELLESVENEAISEGSNFINRNTKWKNEIATERQMEVLKGRLGINASKWDVHKFFINRNIYFAFKEL